MRVLVITNMYPNPDDPNMGIFVKEQVDSIKGQGVDVEILFINGRRTSLNYLKATVQVLIRCLNSHYDLIHAHYGLTGVLAHLQWRYPVIVSFHGSDVNLPGQGFISKILARCICKSIVMTKKMKDKLKSKNTVVIPCGVNLQLMTPIKIEEARERLNLSQDKRYLLFPGSPKNPGKGYGLFRDVLAILKRDGLEVEELVLWSIPHNTVPLYYNASDVMVLVSDSEGSPTVVKEAMACNLPIVSLDVGDVKEITKDTKGCYIARKDPKDIADKIRLALAREGRTNGRERIRDLSLENVAKQIIEVYGEL